MTKFEIYERLWQEISNEGEFVPEKVYTEEEYQLYKSIVSENIALATFVFCELSKPAM